MGLKELGVTLNADRIDLVRHAKIKKALRLRGVTFSGIARELGLKPPTVIIVCQGHRTSRRVDVAIAQALGVTAQDLFPERYRGEVGED